MTSLAIVRPYDSLKVSSRCIKTMSWALYVYIMPLARGDHTAIIGSTLQALSRRSSVPSTLSVESSVQLGHRLLVYTVHGPTTKKCAGVDTAVALRWRR